MQYGSRYTNRYETPSDYYNSCQCCNSYNCCNSCDYYKPWNCCNPCSWIQWCQEQGGTSPSPNGQVGIQLQLQGSTGQGLDNLQAVVCNRVLFQQDSSINYNMTNGEIQITKPGSYFITWWVSVNGTDLGTKVAFSLLTNGQNTITGESPLVTGQVNGSGIVNTTQPAIIKLVNTSNDRIYYGNVDVQANITIFNLN